MATRQIFTDDIDGTEDATTITFALDGANYEVDLAQNNEDRLREFLAEFIDVARPMNDKGKVAKRAARKAAAPQDVTPQVTETPEFDSKLARAWLKENGHTVSNRGRISDTVAAPYLESESYAEWAAQR